jgi:murein L,D-transpeptidase YafK
VIIKNNTLSLIKIKLKKYFILYIKMSCCSNCNTKLLERKYVFNEQDDNGNLFCPNNECEKYTKGICKLAVQDDEWYDYFVILVYIYNKYNYHLML